MESSDLDERGVGQNSTSCQYENRQKGNAMISKRGIQVFIAGLAVMPTLFAVAACGSTSGTVATPRGTAPSLPVTSLIQDAESTVPAAPTIAEAVTHSTKSAAGFRQLTESVDTFGGNIHFAPPTSADSPTISSASALATVGGEGPMPMQPEPHVVLARFRNDDVAQAAKQDPSQAPWTLVWLVLQPDVPGQASGPAPGSSVPGVSQPTHQVSGPTDIFAAIDAHTGKSYGIWQFGR
jgi:hypothetical protein